MLLDKVKHILCISLILLVGVTTLYACKSDDKELQGEPVLQVQKSIGFKKEGGEVADVYKRQLVDYEFRFFRRNLCQPAVLVFS